MNPSMTELLNRMAALESRVAALEHGAAMKLPPPAAEPDVLRNQAGPYSIKLASPTFYTYVNGPLRIGFPRNRRLLARRLEPGNQVFIYITSPEKWVIGLAEVDSRALPAEPLNPGYPYEVPLQWIISPRRPGIRLVDAGIELRPRVGDTLFALSHSKARELTDLLERMPALEPDQLEQLVRRYPEHAN